MTQTKNNIVLALAVLLGLLVLSPALVSAQTSVNLGASASVTGTSNTSAGVTANTSVTLTTAEKNAVARANQEIQRRISALNDLNTRVQAMQSVTASFKASLSTTIQNEISTLTSLQTTIDADTTLASLKTDIGSITTSYRVYALILPQGRIAAAADRVVTIVGMMSTLGSKLQARIQTASAAGNNTTAAAAALTDMSTQLTNAQTQAEASVSTTATLQPDNGVASVMASNEAALKAARVDLQTATSDLQAARKDVTTIVTDLKGYSVSTSASTSASATTTP